MVHNLVEYTLRAQGEQQLLHIAFIIRMTIMVIKSSEIDWSANGMTCQDRREPTWICIAGMISKYHSGTPEIKIAMGNLQRSEVETDSYS